MKPFHVVIFIALILGACNPETNKVQETKFEYALVIHGGAGYSTPENLNEEKQKLYHQKLNEALDLGLEILASGKTSIDAVESVIKLMEDSPLFNAGKGAVFTHSGTNEMDASIMEGKNLNAGAVAGVMDIKNPISAARKVMENSEHVLLSGKGASEFSASQGLEIVDPSYFFTEANFLELLNILNKEGIDTEKLKKEKLGTVGCVALDRNGNIAAGTSTGGRTNKKYGRIGDSPIIGAGTYAKNSTCGVSATGHGEFFIRYAVSHDISALMEYKGMTVNEAASLLVHDKLVKAGGDGGVVCLDKFGNFSMEYNTSCMFRGYANSEGTKFTRIFENN